MAPQAAIEIKSFAETRKEIGDFSEDILKAQRVVFPQERGEENVLQLAVERVHLRANTGSSMQTHNSKDNAFFIERFLPFPYRREHAAFLTIK